MVETFHNPYFNSKKIIRKMKNQLTFSEIRYQTLPVSSVNSFREAEETEFKQRFNTDPKGMNGK